MENKRTREEILNDVADRLGMPFSDVENVYQAIIDELMDAAVNGKLVMLSGFGRFYVQKHKGHPIRFGNNTNEVGDYLVYKFSASNVFNKRMRKAIEETEEQKGKFDA